MAFHIDNMRRTSVHCAEQHTCLSMGPAPRKRRWQLSALAGAAEVPAKYAKDNWRRRAKPVQEGSTYPAKEHCSHCGLCDTYYVAHVKEACAFLGSGVPATYGNLCQQYSTAMQRECGSPLTMTTFRASLRFTCRHVQD